MSDQDQRVERNEERVEDLEVRTDEAREVAGGAKANPRFARFRKAIRYGKAAGEPINERKLS